MAAEEAQFGKGTTVEVSNDDDGFRGAWYTATIIEPSRKRKRNTTTQKSEVTVEYKTLRDDSGDKPLIETIDFVQIRPQPPRERSRIFKFSEEVDAYYNDGWWEGVVTEVLENCRYLVYFRGTKDQMEFGESDLRLHREWVNGNWMPHLADENVSEKTVVKTGKVSVKEKFSKGTLIEVSSDEDGFQGAWFSATVVKAMGKDKFLIEYQSLRTDDDTELLREEVDILHIRPKPPETLVVDRFSRLEEVDALYNDGWWVGVISKVLSDSMYLVYFRGTDEELKFSHSDLRPHQDWIDGKWFVPSRALKL